ncbi:uncharacterized protein LOC142324633 isoform X4 [Lycorma delicatula]|uniref:uncharacterized protein LOC142324633 isoform X4 n=1 Tax=Lycorma delicatula TaxID=130591 RepID=UPI003F51A750
MVHIHAVTHQNLEEDMLYRCLVDSGAIGKVEDRKVTCTITNPSRSLTENHITSLADGTYRIGCYTPFEEVPPRKLTLLESNGGSLQRKVVGPVTEGSGLQLTCIAIGGFT